MLNEPDLFGERDRIQIAIDRIKNFAPVKPDQYYLAFSGGKDSIVIKKLCDLAGVPFESHYQLTCLDPPELIYYIREHHPDVFVNRPRKTFWQGLITNGYPTRMRRWCCAVLKESAGKNRSVITGIRWSESTRRKGRPMAERCNKEGGKQYLHPIIDWSKSDVWDFIHKYDLPYCKLYDEGFNRLGCLFCCMASYENRVFEAKRYPKYVQVLRYHFKKMYDHKVAQDNKYFQSFKNSDELFYWWIFHKRGSKTHSIKTGEQQTLFD